jgi:hypothetical protein
MGQCGCDDAAAAQFGQGGQNRHVAEFQAEFQAASP